MDELRIWVSLELKQAEKNKRDSLHAPDGFYHKYNTGRAVALRSVLGKIDVLLEKPAADSEKPATADVYKIEQYALVNTVDTIIGFLDRGVYLFDSQELALEFAVETIREHCTYTIARATTDDEILEYFQDDLQSIEYFHVERVFNAETLWEHKIRVANEQVQEAIEAEKLADLQAKETSGR